MKSVSLWRVWLLIISLPIAMVFGVKLMALTELVNEALFGRHDWVLDGLTPAERAIGMFYTLVVLFGSATAAFIPYAVILCWIIRRRFTSLTCLKCRYSIVGLPVVDGYLKCPECGQDICLKEHGWSRDDVIAGKTGLRSESVKGGGSSLMRSVLILLAIVALGAWVASGERTYLVFFLLTLVAAMVFAIPWSASRRSHSGGDAHEKAQG